ncbi:hypothetical protein [Pseudidiomarina salilacus]|uniref:hypothetical protein n=1 Tax=Pseudidiomarina salilacus TaxID=3384452 RepID=UPI003984D3C2
MTIERKLLVLINTEHVAEHSLALLAEVEAAGASPGELRMLRQIHYLAIQPFTTRCSPT